jgi:hypothetical protein
MASADNNGSSPYDLIPELGDSVTFISDVYGRTYGRIIYRDGSVIRIRPYTSSTTSVEFPLDPDTGLFLERLGVSEVIIHEKRKDPHFVVQMSFVPGEQVELFGSDGKMLSEPAIIYEVIATDEYDAIRLENGEVIDFAFLGPPAPITMIRAVEAPEEAVPPENEGAAAVYDEPEREDAFPELDYDLLPAALVEEIPTEERTYSDSIQREDMFIGLLTDYPSRRQKDPKVMQQLYRATDLLLALKNSVIQRAADGAPLRDATPRSYIAVSVQEAIEKQSTGAPLSSVVPVINTKKVLYVDDAADGEFRDTEIRSDIGSLVDLSNAGLKFADFVSETSANPYIMYLNRILGISRAYVPAGPGACTLTVDQDVLRSAIPPAPVEGFVSVPSAISKKKSEPPPSLTTDFIGSISDRYVRLIGPSRIVDPGSGSVYTIMPGDTSETIANILLSNSLSAWRSQTRSSVLLWDVQASESSRGRKGKFYSELQASLSDQIILNHEHPVALAEVLGERLLPSLSYITKENVAIMDSLGMRYLEFTEDTFAPFVAATIAGISAWDRSYNRLRQQAIGSLEKPSQPALANIADKSSPLMNDTTFGNSLLKEAVTPLLEKETSLVDSDLALANNISKEAFSTLTPLWYAAANQDSAPELLTEAENTYKAERGRIQRSTAVQRGLQKEFSSAPSINPCPHVHELEKVRGVRNDQERMLIFQKFLKTYQGGQDGNWIQCSSCAKDLVCKHELLLLNEFLNPGRGVALHKALLLEFAGPVFESAYICKNCGQKISDLEYDTHLEFDDEGRPLVGRSVLEPVADDELDLVLASRAEAEEKIPYAGAERNIYFNLRTLFERCGMAMSDAVYARTVLAAKSYLEKNLKDEARYEELRAGALKQKRVLVPYETYKAETHIKIVGALVILELQTSDVTIPIPAGGCKLSRDGFPRDGGDPGTAGTGAVSYVSCALAGIMNLNPPWSKTSWSPETRMEVRIRTIETILLGTLFSMLSLPLPKSPIIPPPIDNVTDVYKELLRAAIEKRATIALDDARDARASYGDKLPHAFRPLPQSIAPSGYEETPIGNVAQFERNIKEGDIEEVATLVKSRARQLTQSLIGDFHSESARGGVIVMGAGRSDSVCCFKRLGAISVSGMGVQGLDVGAAKLEEARLIDRVSSSFTRRDPALPGSGTHIMVPWSAPISTSVLPESDPSSYYKLFLKNCFRGRNYGGVHEFGSNNVCRHCEFRIPEDLLYAPGADVSETDGRRREAEVAKIMARRQEAALLAFNTQGIEINAESFRALEEQIRRRKTVPPTPPLLDIPYLQGIQNMAPLLAPLIPIAAEDWKSFISAMTEIQTKGLQKIQRLRALSEFSTRYDQRIKSVQAALTAGISNPRESAALLEKLALLNTITDSPIGGASARNVIQIFVTRAEQIARGFTNVHPNMIKWFHSVSRSHRELVNTIWEKEAGVTTRALASLGEFSEGEAEVVETIRLALMRFTTWLGPWMAIWIRDFRPGVVLTEEEYILKLRWTVYIGILSLLTPSSPLYAGAPSLEAQVGAVGFMRGWLMDNISTFADTVNKYQLSPEEIRDALNARIELEKAMFINEFDKQDLEGRRLERLKKGLKIGRWNVTDSMFTINKEGFEFAREQRARMGLPEYDGAITGGAVAGAGAGAGAGAAGENPFGFMDFGAQPVGMNDSSNLRAAQDEDEV